MRNTKFQTPKCRATPSPNPQARQLEFRRRHQNFRCLQFGISLVFGFWSLVFSLPSSVSAQTYALDWSTIDGGGGTSTGGVYAVSGAIGQPDAGRMSGGNYSVDGGFWGLIAAVQPPGSPLLSIARTSTNTIAVSWPSPSAGFVLQVNTNGVNTVNWSNVVTAPLDDGSFKTVIVNPPVGNRIYRLMRP